MQRDFHHKKSLGQNFMFDENVARKMVRETGVDFNDIVLEVGPGTGILTKCLLETVGEVISVEIDNRLTGLLRERFAGYGNFELIEGDFLEYDISGLALEKGRKLKVMGNIPYHITSPILFHIFDHREAVESYTATIQKEVAKRIVSEPGSRDYGILSVFSRLYSEPEILFSVSKQVFDPVPKVDSAVITLRFDGSVASEMLNESTFRTIVKTSFGKRRKMLRNSLKYLGDCLQWITEQDFDLTRRPEMLSVGEFIYLANLVERWKEEKLVD